jgi:hypothetical protein
MLTAFRWEDLKDRVRLENLNIAVGITLKVLLNVGWKVGRTLKNLYKDGKIILKEVLKEDRRI